MWGMWKWPKWDHCAQYILLELLRQRQRRFPPWTHIKVERLNVKTLVSRARHLTQGCWLLVFFFSFLLLTFSFNVTHVTFMWLTHVCSVSSDRPHLSLLSLEKAPSPMAAFHRSIQSLEAKVDFFFFCTYLYLHSETDLWATYFYYYRVASCLSRHVMLFFFPLQEGLSLNPWTRQVKVK